MTDTQEARGPAGARRQAPYAVVLTLIVLCAVAAVAVLATGANLLLRRSSRSGVETARTQALTAAKVAAGDILGSDYRTVEQSTKRARSETTGAFRKKYDVTASELLLQSKRLKTVVRATVGAAAVMSASRDQVVVLLFVDEAMVKQQPGKKTPDTRIDQSRVRLTMTHTGGRWLVSDLAVL
jgi:Mce-associated membrane protein